jgi:hypothetical protein
VAAFAEVAGLDGPGLFELSVAVAEALANAVVPGRHRSTTTSGCASSATRTRSPSRWWTAATYPPRRSRAGGGGDGGRGIHFMRALVDAAQYT